jgi:hypothetical protein
MISDSNRGNGILGRHPLVFLGVLESRWDLHGVSPANDLRVVSPKRGLLLTFIKRAAVRLVKFRCGGCVATSARAALDTRRDVTLVLCANRERIQSRVATAREEAHE